MPTLRDWFGVLAMVVGLFMAIMDVQIVTSSLTQIQGGLSASADEISWVQTAYLIADVMMVPLSGTLSRLLSTRVLFVTAALGFTGASALVRHRDEPRPDDRLSGNAGVQRRRHDAVGLSGHLYEIPNAAAGDGHGADLADPEPVVDPGPDDRRLLDRHLLLALAVPGQHRARHRRCRHRMALDRHRQARVVAVAPFRSDRAGADGAVSRLPPIRAPGRPTLGLAFGRTRSSPRSSCRASRRPSSSGAC